jgi:hypothetical protein
MENVTDDSRTNVPLETAFIRSAEQADSLTMIIDIDATMFTSADAESFAAAYIDALTRMTRNVHAPHATMSVD